MSVLNIIRKLQEKDKEIRLLILGLDNAGKTTILHRFLDQDIDQISPTVGFNIKTIQYIPSQHNIDDNDRDSGVDSRVQLDTGMKASGDVQHHNNDDNSAVVKDHVNTTNLSPSTPAPPRSTQSPNHIRSGDTAPSKHNDQQYNITIWDVGGQSTIRSFWSNYFAHTDGLVWVIDSTDVTRFDLCIDTLRSVLRQEKLSGVSLLILANKQDVQFAHSLEQIAQMLGLNAAVGQLSEDGKQQQQQQEGESCRLNHSSNNGLDQVPSSTSLHLDSTHTNTDDEQFNNDDQGLASILSHHWFLQGCSARANTGIKQGFKLLIDDIIKRLYLLE